jgi:hypothetical protein
VSSPNPGISAAGEAAGRTALNPSTGPAAIGGMVVPGESDPVPPVPQRVRSASEDWLTTVVSDITTMAKAMSALSLDIRTGEVAPHEQHRGYAGGGQDVTAAGSPEPVPGASSPPHTSQGLGATGAVATGIGGYANVPAASADTHRQTASRYRA